MNTTKPSKMPYVILAIIVAIAALIYFYLTGNTTSESQTLQELSTANQVEGAQVLSLLNEISSLKIDNSFFNNPSYKTLRDYSVQIPALSVGRPNPFSSVPGLVAPNSNGGSGR